MLFDVGYFVDFVEDGKVGVVMVVSIVYDLIFMDISMSGMDGIEIFQKICVDNGLFVKMFIVVFMVYLCDEDLGWVKFVGIYYILIKFIFESVFEVMIFKVMGDQFFSVLSYIVLLISNVFVDRDVVVGVICGLGCIQVEVNL